MPKGPLGFRRLSSAGPLVKAEGGEKITEKNQMKNELLGLGLTEEEAEEVMKEVDTREDFKQALKELGFEDAAEELP